MFGRGERGSSCWDFTWAERAFSSTGLESSESDVPLILANLGTGTVFWEVPCRLGFPALLSLSVRGGRAALTWPPAQVGRHWNSLVSLREEKLQLCNHQVPNHKHLGGNSCGEHLAELEYGQSFLGMEILIT